jgi:hypothetical protein
MSMMAQRVQNLESIAQGREKLVSLGTMAAGLAHELNNPAAAGRRAAQELKTTFIDLQSRSCKMNKQQLEPEQTEHLVQAQSAAMARAATQQRLDPLEQSDREDEVASWLEEHDIDESWQLAPTFVAAGLDSAWFDDLSTRLPATALPRIVLWLEASLRADALYVKSTTARAASLVWCSR